MDQSPHPDLTRRGSTELVSVQILRGFAALIVVVFHCFDNRIAAPWAACAGFGTWGVDIFFVISGLVMWISTEGRPASPAMFLSHRFIRIFPLYWIVLTLWIAGRAIHPDSLSGDDLSPRSVILSYMLLPHYHAVYTRFAWPILTVGWTLQLELFFYVLFASALTLTALPGRLSALASLLVALSMAGYGIGGTSAVASVYTSPLLLEFAAGMALGVLARRRRIPGATSGGVLILGAFGAVFAFHRFAGDDALRPLALGVPAVMLVAGSLAYEDRLRLSARGFWVALGAASYSLYLTHPIGIAVVAVVWTRAGLPREVGPGLLAAFVTAAVAASVGLGFSCHRWLEAPLLDACKGFVARHLGFHGRRAAVVGVRP